MRTATIRRLASALPKSWSRASSTRWKAGNPALGQCGVTALVVQDFLGGDILKTRIAKPGVGELWHYYNLIDGEAVDFTVSQFDEPIPYDDCPSTREEAFQDTNARQYRALRSAVSAHLENA